MDSVQGLPESQHSPENPVTSFVTALHGIIPTLDRIRLFIEDSTGKIPQASKQLSSVATATEVATTEILDLLERSTQTLSDVETSVAKLKSISERQQLAGAALRALAASLPSTNGTSAWSEHVTAIEESNRDASTICEELAGFAKSAKDDIMSISIALQVQDITSQQIAGVSQVIESVREQLSKALSNFEHPIESLADATAPSLSVPKVFDHGASYDTSQDRQESADEIIKRWQQEGH
ncbi:MAG: protein phosphatase CheZ [Ignavibacteriae bacterium]|nr:protein phosphatase CheZ [Ignavibacteriota bacterium]